METFQQLLINLAIVIIPVVGTFVVAYIKKKTEQLNGKINIERQQSYLNIASQAIQLSVSSVFQTYVDGLKKSGTFNKDNHIEAFNKAKESVSRILSDSVKQAVTEAYGDLDTYLNTAIEKYVHQNKSK